jgi:hypothetical protein
MIAATIEAFAGMVRFATQWRLGTYLRISLSTLDNPGWAFKVDLKDTYLSDRKFDEVRVEGADQNDWYVCK